MKKVVIAIITILLISMVVASFALKTQAVGISVLSNPDKYISQADDNSKILDIGNIIVWVVKTVGNSIAILGLIIIGIKYIMGSVEEKAEYKQTMWPYIVGAILIFAGSNITNIIYQMVHK